MTKQNNKLILILAFMAVFLITNGTFFALCEKDIVLDYINKFGDWTNAVLWQSSKGFLYYAAADTFYNIRYIAPKLAYTLAPVKWADRVNGWLGGNATGELERHLAQDKYHPLYKDALNIFNNNVASPLLGYLGIRPLIIEKQIPIFVDRVRTEYRDRVETRIEYRTRDNENILSVRNSLNDLRSAVQQNTILTNGLQQNFADLHAEISRLELLGRLENLHVTDLQDICRLDNEWLPSNHQLIRIEADDEFMLSTGYPAPGLRVFYRSKSIFASAQSEHSLLISGFWFCNTYPKVSELIEGYSQNAVTTEIRIVYRNNIIDSSNCSFIKTDTQDNLKIVDYIRDNALLVVNNPQTSFDLLISRVDERLNEISGRRSNQGSQTDNLSEHSVALDQIEEFLDTESQNNLSMLSRQNPSDSIFGVSSTNMSAAATMGTLGIIGAISQLPVNDIFTIFSHFLGLSHFEPLLANPDAVRCLASIYAQATGSIPGVLADAYTLPNLQDYLLPGESLLEPSTPSLITPNADATTPYYNWKMVGVTILGGCAIAGGIYLWKNGYLDYNTAVETAKSLKDTLHERYVNFK